MSSIHVQSVVWTVRFYPDDGGYPGPFIGVATIQAIGSHAIYVSSMHGTITRKHVKELASRFVDLGYTTVFMQRHGRIKQRPIAKYL